jgi:tRNA pseudouridine38-40 synthase
MANYLIGMHDFNSFRSTYCQTQMSVRSLDYIKILKIDDVIHIELKAKSFLHNQVRIIVGTLKHFHHHSLDIMDGILRVYNRIL